ncbi:LysM peptidoglycan-binding domain-containing protein [Cohnella sp. CFH 77786]|uniref:cell wall hydrolase n=1 Tax=Cohnella sp. CFH 77786 TaxID=2662265 RepID=UPI001C60DDEF|nr:cell wall hydrolase [Cohnella sp. CFH 77786]MBW5447736.1 LysM peptidoglycan-binding domain-containing protein [Cohnella sp. CFH 77786]
MAGIGSAFAGSDNNVSIEGQPIEWTQALWIDGGWTYVPVREFSERMGWTLSYDKQSGLITVSNQIGGTLSFRTGSPAVTFNDKKYELPEPVAVRNDNAYLPVRLLAEAMHARVKWNDETNTADIVAVPEHIVAEGETLSGIAQAYDTTVELLKLRNGIGDESLQIGQRLKVIVPEFLDPASRKTAVAPKAAAKAAPEIDPADLELLAKLVQVEAGNEPYEGKLAVASVVMNRVRDPDFPNTVKGVIYAPYQFPPAGNGLLAKAKPSKDSTRAAKAALSGENNVPGAVYFFNAKLEPAKKKKVTVVKVIGSHTFAK